jgi:ATP-dependent protease HslVU (ClpYQ) peptidase subunit
MRDKAESILRTTKKAKWTSSVGLVLLISFCGGCATGQFTLLASAEKDEVEQLKENVYRVEYRVSSFTSQEQLDAYLRRRCAELTLREGYDFFHLSQRADVLALSRRTSITVTMFKGRKPAAAADLYGAEEVLAEPPTVSKHE